MKITTKDLENVVRRINIITKNPEKSWENKDGKMVSNIGNYHLDGAYGGYALCQMVNEQGGVRSIISGFYPKRELYDRMQSYINGLMDAKS
jgi:hypothetical protein